MKRLLIIGAGASGCEIYSLLNGMHNNEWEFGGFLEDNPANIANKKLADKIVGSVTSYTPNDNDLLVCSIANPAIKLNICELLKMKGSQFTNLIHKTAIVAEDACLGEGLILFPYTYISTNAELGSFINLNIYSSIGHNAILGNGCTISAHCDVTGYVNLGRGVFMGSHSAIIPRIKVADFAIIGAGSTVMRNVPANTTVLGVPAKRISMAVD